MTTFVDITTGQVVASAEEQEEQDRLKAALARQARLSSTDSRYPPSLKAWFREQLLDKYTEPGKLPRSIAEAILKEEWQR